MKGRFTISMSGLLKEKNEFIVFETENVKIEELTLLDHPVYKK